MKISISGLDIEPGKVKHEDPRLSQLVDKVQPKKVSPYYVEIMEDEFVQADAIAVAEDKLLDLLIHDMEKCETWLQRNPESADRELIGKCLEWLEQEKPLSQYPLDDTQKETLRSFGLASLKPIIVITGEPDIQDIIGRAFQGTQTIFFYTAGPKEVHAWDVKENDTLLTCAGKIHTDLARGFIKGDVVSFDDFMACHNFNDCKKQGLVRVGDKEDTISSGDILEIRFNV